MARKEAPLRVRLNASAAWELMARQNLSQNELARRLGITSGYLSQLVNGQRYPSPSLRRRLLEQLKGASFEDLFVVEHRGTLGEGSLEGSADGCKMGYIGGDANGKQQLR